MPLWWRIFREQGSWIVFRGRLFCQLSCTSERCGICTSLSRLCGRVVAEFYAVLGCGGAWCCCMGLGMLG